MARTDRLGALGVVLPEVAGPFGAYVPARLAGSWLFVAGQLPYRDGALVASGPVPSRCSLEGARLAARQCVINGLAAARTAVELDRLTGVIRVGAFVWSDPGFSRQPEVADGASELLLAIFGPAAGGHVRTAVGTSALPREASVEIDFVFAVGDPD